MMNRPAAFTCLVRTISSSAAAGAFRIDIRRLRDAKPPDQAVLLRQALASPAANNTSITDQLLNSVAKGNLPDLPVRTWLSIAEDPRVTVAVVCQPYSATLRRLAMPVLTAQLRGDATFKSTWDALGGSEGIVKLLSQFSLTDLRLFLRSLRGTALASGKTRAERQERLGELFMMLNDSTHNPDKRPLHIEYAHILPSCPPRMALARTDQTSANTPMPLRWRELFADDHRARDSIWKRVNKAHWSTVAEMTFEDSFSGPEGKVDWEQLRPSLARSKSLRLKAFQVLASSNDFQGVPPRDIMEKLIIPLARQYSRRRSDSKTGSNYWALLVNCLKRHPTLFKYDTVRYHEISTHHTATGHGRSLTEYFVRAWGHSVLSDAELAAYLKALPERDAKRIPVEDILKQVRVEKRYALLRLFFKNNQCYQLDIGPPSNLASDALKELKISVEVFLLLPGAEAMSLFERLHDAHPGCGYSALEPWNYKKTDIGNMFQLSLNNEDESLNPDGPVLRGFLLRRSSSSSFPLPVDPRHVRNHLRVTELSRRKALAQQGRTAELRAFWAVAACRLCIAMGDIDAYANTLIWARRFNKDPLVLKILYHEQELRMPQLLKLLSVVDGTPLEAEKLHENIQKANWILMILLETAAMAVDTSSFCRSDWKSAYQLIPEVVELRLTHYRKLQTQMKWSDDEVFHAILQPTLDMLIAAETLILRPGYERLGFQNPNGFSLINGMDTSVEFTPSVVRFLDMLAERRDRIWATYRASIDPRVLTLEGPWPKGLPVQCLWPENHIENAGNAAFLQKRAKEAVFCDPQAALSPAPTCPKTQSSIGVFVDDWSVALRLYTHMKDDDSDRDTRILRTWKYALDHLTGERMSTEEAHRFWAPLFPRSGSIAKLLNEGVPSRSYAPFPSAEFDKPPESREWDPDPTYNAVTSYRKDERYLQGVTALDCMVKPGWKTGTPWTRRKLTWTKPVVPKHSKNMLDFWRAKCPAQSLGSELDDQMMAAILCLNNTHGANISLFGEPSMSEKNQLAPSLFLARDFLERESLMVDKIVSALRMNHSRVPPQLLARLGESILQRIRENPIKNEGVYGVFYMIIRMLFDGPNPSLASPLIKEFIIEIPQASGWHRYLLTPYHLNRLEPQRAEEFVESLSNGMVEKLRLQQAGEKPESGHTVSEALIKVSTVKSVEQLLREKAFTTHEKAVDILSNILRHTSNKEIQVAAIKALISLLTDDGPKSEILRLLKQYAAPLASSLNERHPETESEWKLAKNGRDLPLVDHGKDGHPVLDMLMPRKHKTCNVELLQLAGQALRTSSQANSRWLTLFLKKYEFDELFTLPQIPAHPEILLELLRRTDPRDISLEDFIVIRDYVLFLLDQPQAVRDITTYVKNNRKLANSNAGRHWLHLWCKSSKEALGLGGGWAAEMLTCWTTAHQEDKKSSTMLAMAEDFVLRIADIAISRGDLSLFDDLVSRIPTDDLGRAYENAGSGKIITQLIRRIDGLRTPEWQADYHRQPSTLPSTLPLRLRLLDLYHGNADAVSTFAEMLVELLREVTKGGRLYHEDFEVIRKYLKTRISNQSVPSLAIALGSLEKLDSWTAPTTADYLRARLAAQLLDCNKVNDDNDNDNDVKQGTGLEIWDMLNTWKRSPIEEFRNLAREAHPQVEST